MKRYKLKPEIRDHAMLAALEFWGILGIGQLEDLAFSEGATPEERCRRLFNEYPRDSYKGYPCKRLLRLEREGYIHGNTYLRFPKLYTLTAKGHAELKARGMSCFPGFRDALAEAFVRHEVTVNAVGLVLKELLRLDVRVERERYIWSKTGGRSPAPTRLPVSDLWVVDAHQPKAIEVELTQKSWRRYEVIWDAYRRRLRPNAVVLYLTAWPSGVQRILHLARRFGADHIYACSLEAFRRSIAREPFIGCRQGQKVVLTRHPLSPVEVGRPAELPIPASVMPGSGELVETGGSIR